MKKTDSVERVRFLELIGIKTDFKTLYSKIN